MTAGVYHEGRGHGYAMYLATNRMDFAGSCPRDGVCFPTCRQFSVCLSISSCATRNTEITIHVLRITDPHQCVLSTVDVLAYGTYHWMVTYSIEMAFQPFYSRRSRKLKHASSCAILPISESRTGEDRDGRGLEGTRGRGQACAHIERTVATKDESEWRIRVTILKRGGGGET